MNFYPFHIGDYISHTRHLSLLEDLAYRRLLDAYYLSEKPFVGSPADIAKEIGMMSEIEEVYYVLQRFFESTENGWINKRCDEEIAKYQAMKDGGRKGAAMRWAKGSDTPPIDTPMLTKNQEPLTNNHNIVDVAKAPKAKRLDVKELPEEWENFCKENRPELNPKAVFDQFRDYWIAQGGQKGAKVDWLATWRNWVRNQKAVAGTPISKELPLNTDQQIAYAYQTECGGDPTRARFNNYYEMKKYVLDFRDRQKRGVV